MSIINLEKFLPPPQRQVRTPNLRRTNISNPAWELCPSPLTEVCPLSLYFRLHPTSQRNDLSAFNSLTHLTQPSPSQELSVSHPPLDLRFSQPALGLRVSPTSSQSRSSTTQPGTVSGSFNFLAGPVLLPRFYSPSSANPLLPPFPIPFNIPFLSGSSSEQPFPSSLTATQTVLKKLDALADRLERTEKTVSTLLSAMTAFHCPSFLHKGVSREYFKLTQQVFT